MSFLRIAAIDFLNPAPLMWSFEHPPEAARLASRYSIEKMTPARCAERLGAGDAELGLIPIAAYPSLPNLRIVPGCAIASLGAIRSILLVLRSLDTGANPARSTESDLPSPAILEAVRATRSVALDTASRTSAMYTRILFRKYWHAEPRFLPHPPALDQMLRAADAALLIGDPALFALEDRAAREQRTGERLHYLDLGAAWREQTTLPWVSAFWAARLPRHSPSADKITADLTSSRDAGLANLPALTSEWSRRLGLPPATIRTYLGYHIHYHLDEVCLRGIDRFYADAQECDLISQCPALAFL